MKRLAPLALLSLALLAAPALAQPKSEEPRIELHFANDAVSVGQAIRAWAKATGRRGLVGQQAERIKLEVSNAPKLWTAKQLRQTLAFHGVQVVADEHALRAVTTRNLAQLLGPNAPIYRGDAKLPADGFVTLVLEIQHGAASAIYANLRGIMARDQSRAGNILYVQGPERIIITDLGHKASHYRELVRMLDVPPPPSPKAVVQVEVYALPSAAWAELNGKHAEQAAQGMAAAVKAGGAQRLERSRVNLADGVSLEQDMAGVAFAIGCTKGRVTLELASGEDETRQSRRLTLSVPELGGVHFLAGQMQEGKAHVVVLRLAQQ